MAVRGWGGSIATAIGVAAGAGAAQLGLGYGLGIIAWLPTASDTSEVAWVASLAWATWIAATSTVAGAVTAHRLSGTTTPPSTAGRRTEVPALADGLWRLALAVAAAVGALVTVALVAVPARAAVRADTFSPQTIAAGYAVVGVVVGLVVAVGALSSRAVAANVIVTVSWLWLLAIVAVTDSLASGAELTSAHLGIWQFSGTGPSFWFRNLYLPGVALSLGSAAIIGALAAWPAARRGAGRVGIAISGAAGPLLLATAYFLAAPQPVGVPTEQPSAYLVAPYAVIAGLAGSVLISTLGTRAGRGAPLAGEAAGRSAEPLRPAPRTPAPRTPAAGTPATTPAVGATPATSGSQAAGSAGAGSAAGRPDDPARPYVDDDEYAPARAYVSETVGDPEPAAARGQAAVATPLWPPHPDSSATAAKGKAGRGKDAR